jgi:hypothetical protein
MAAMNASAISSASEALDRTKATRTARISNVRTNYNANGEEISRLAAAGLIDFERELCRTSTVFRQSAVLPRPKIPLRQRFWIWRRAVPVWLFTRFGQGKREWAEFVREASESPPRLQDPEEIIRNAAAGYQRVNSGSAWLRTPLPAARAYLFGLRPLLEQVDSAEFAGEGEIRNVPCTSLQVSSEGGGSYEVWLDSEGRVRRLAHREEAPAWWPGIWTEETTELWDFGLHVVIEIPPEDDLLSLRDAHESTHGPSPPSPLETDTPFG